MHAHIHAYVHTYIHTYTISIPGLHHNRTWSLEKMIVINHQHPTQIEANAKGIRRTAVRRTKVQESLF
jgi:hypothetical protein